MPIYNTKYFSERARAVHSDKYSYEKVQYLNTHTKVIITCPAHGDFEQRPNDHLRGKGCSKCLLLSLEKFIETSKKVHNEKYL